jgi:putative membrane protein
MKHRLIVAVLAAAVCLFANAADIWAQQGSSPADAKPAQAGSPAAHPTEASDRNGATTRNNTNETISNENRNVVRNESRSEERTSADKRDMNVDRDFAACLLQKNKAEVELGKIAADRSHDKDVKDFAEKMVKDHKEVIEKLERLVGSNEPNDRRSELERRINDQCLSNLKKELNDKSGREFDACYMGSQLAGHMEMTAALEVLSKEMSGELQDIVKDAQPKVEKHLSNAKDIIKQLDKSSGEHQASRDRSNR